MKINNYSDLFVYIKNNLKCIKCNNDSCINNIAHFSCKCGFINNLFQIENRIHLIFFEKGFGFISVILLSNNLYVKFVLEKYNNLFESKTYQDIFKSNIIEDIQNIQNKILKLNKNLCFM